MSRFIESPTAPAVKSCIEWIRSCMTNSVTIVALLWTVLASAARADARPTSASITSSWPPPQLEIRVPFEPTAFPSAGRTYLTYELHLRNFGTNPLTLRRIDVLDADATTAEPIATFEAGQLDALLQPVGAQKAGDGSSDRRQLAGGGSVVMFMWIALEHGAHVPNRLRHRLFTADWAADGAVIGTHHTDLRVLGPPVKGAHWLAGSGPSNDSYHRRGLLVFDGRAVIDRRYAIDWKRIEKGTTFSGDELDNRSYHAYGQAVLAVADGRVVVAKDGIPDNVPRHEGFRAAVPITMETVAGNTLTLDLGRGQFAYYMHLQPSTLRVKAGDHVRRGQILARIGNSGDAREPHLHFEVTTSSRLLAGEGVPYLIDQYRLLSPDGSFQVRTHELPLKDMLVDFGPAAAVEQRVPATSSRARLRPACRGEAALSRRGPVCEIGGAAQLAVAPDTNRCVAASRGYTSARRGSCG
jgi:Peptidase family M23